MAARATASALKASIHLRNNPYGYQIAKAIPKPLIFDTASFYKSPQRSARAHKPLPSIHRTFHTSPSYSSTDASPKYSYRIAASFSAKDGPYDPSKNIFLYDPLKKTPTYLDVQRKSERPDSGQDAFFVTRIGETDDVALGVCDGVGGWADSGVDPADFSHGICGYMAEAASRSLPSPHVNRKVSEWTAQNLMQRGYEEICEDKNVRAGGSTACVAIAKSNGQVEVANLGDSGFIHFRLNAIHGYSEPQVHAFNTPYQLSLIPGNVKRRAAAFGGYQLHDEPSDAHISTRSVRHGDVLLLASDGVWDNLSSQDLLRIVSHTMIESGCWVHTSTGISTGEILDSAASKGALTDGEEPSLKKLNLQSKLASRVAGLAKSASMDRKRDGPFAREVRRYYPEEGWRGGKVDDICVVATVVVEDFKSST